jgi:preprotein translocase subunit SecG
MDNDQSRTTYLKAGLAVALIAGAAALAVKGMWNVFFFYVAAAGVILAGAAEYRPGTSPEDLRKLIKKWAIISLFFFAAALMYLTGSTTLLIVYVVVIAFVAVLAILLQSGRGGGLSASFGGVGGDSLLGARSATPIAKATYVMLALFVFNAVMIANLTAKGEPEASPVAPVEQSAPANQPAE